MSKSLPHIMASLLAMAAGPLFSAQFVVLDESNWSAFAPLGKEADCIHGDYALRNDALVAVIGEAVPSRNANMRLRRVGGCLIDLTERTRPNDQFGAFYPAPGRQLSLHGVRIDGKQAELAAGNTLEGKSIELIFDAAPADGAPPAAECRVHYRLADGDEGLAIVNELSNPSDELRTALVEDAIRVDSEFKWGVDADQGVFWANDVFWRQAYCLTPDGLPLSHVAPSDERSEPLLRYGHAEGIAKLAPRETTSVTRRIFPGENELAARAKALRQKGITLRSFKLTVRDPAGPVADAVVTVKQGDNVRGVALTPSSGELLTELPVGEYEATVRHYARGETTAPLAPASNAAVTFELPACGYVAGMVTDSAGAAIACKVDFEPLNGAAAPDFGPDSAVYGVRNLIYTPNGKFRVEVRPGKYRVLISHGPEFDADSQEIVVSAGAETAHQAVLARSVDAAGWLSADFHSHSSPSGDNAASQLGRVLNLLAEHIEFAPCTEHNRITNYLPHLETLAARDRMATCPGMELTGQPLPLNHQNAFPLVEHLHAQDGGGPTTDPDPVVQIERLAMWDASADKLVQSNHPNIFQMLGDKDLDGRPDGGFERMFGYMDVIEVHPPERIFAAPDDPATAPGPNHRGNAMVNWMQLLNLGYRVPGVVNTDAHWNFHGSGWLRNYIRAATDDPARADVMELVHAAEHGRIVMTNGPFLSVAANAKVSDGVGEKVTVGPGDDLAAPAGAAELHLRVQCPNWLDVNRVQVFVNGRPDAQLNFTRRTHPEMFGGAAVKFDRTIEVQLAGDAHLIVAAANEGAMLGRVYGPDAGGAMPVAVANPIFVDVDGGGFQPNGDNLGLPLPVPPDHRRSARVAPSGG